MIVISFDKWSEEKLTQFDHLTGDARLVECAGCDGMGEVECDCCGNDSSCSECDGEGVMDITRADENQPSRTAYFDEVITETKMFCAWCNRDFLGEIGPFIKEFRGYT